jgi:hypothetical protein
MWPSDLVVVALIGAVSSVIGIIVPTGAVYLSRREQRRDAIRAEQKLEHITELTNSGATEARDEISALKVEVSKLREFIGAGKAVEPGGTSENAVPRGAKK